MRWFLTNVCVWIAAITLAISVGGNLFQGMVIDPVWTASAPESVQTFTSQTSLVSGVKRFHQNLIYLFGLLCLVASPFLAWNKPTMRKWLLIAAVIYIGILVVTALYFYPMNAVLG
jgi:uncharacterized membrane protein